MWEIRVPKLGMDATEADVARWHVAVGDRVEVGGALVEVESEKTSFTIESEVAGVVREILVPAVQTVPVGTVLGIVDDGAG
jgi:pyruvate/2-oxoglutarate dehydrogenase complex dihydrolipoamide acyltransferase (E2) component